MRGLSIGFVVSLFASIAHADAPKCPTAAARVVAKGVWLGVSGGARCFAPNKDGKVDEGVVGPGLDALAATYGSGCARTIQIAGDSGAAYQSIISTMDLAIKAGLTDVALTDPPGLSVKIDDSAALERKAKTCTPASAPAPAPAPTPASPPAAPAKAAIADAPIVVITATDVSVDGTSVGDVKTLAKGKGAISALAKALKDHKAGDKHTAILQADESSSVAVINRVVATAKAAGYDNLLFAVKNK